VKNGNATLRMRNDEIPDAVLPLHNNLICACARARAREREREREREGGARIGKVISLCRQTTFTQRRAAHDRESLRGRRGDAYNLALAQKEWASPGSKLTVIDRAG